MQTLWNSPAWRTFPFDGLAMSRGGQDVAMTSDLLHGCHGALCGSEERLNLASAGEHVKLWWSLATSLGLHCYPLCRACL